MTKALSTFIHAGQIFVLEDGLSKDKKYCRNECKSQVDGIKNPKFRKFYTLSEAEEFVRFWKNKVPSPNKLIYDGKSCTSPSSPNINTSQREYSKAFNSERLEGGRIIQSEENVKNESVNFAHLENKIRNCEKKIDFYINGLSTIVSGLKDLKHEFGQMCKRYSGSNIKGKSKKKSGSEPKSSKENCYCRDGNLFEYTSDVDDHNISQGVSIEDLELSKFEECKASGKRKRSSSSSEEDTDEDRSSKRNRKVANAKSEKGLASFTQDEDEYVAVYTDGCCLGNGSSYAKAGIGVWFGDDHPLNVSEPFRGVMPTNNNAEIQAARIAIETALKANIPKLKIITDSQFLINSVTQWLPKWKMNNWISSSNNEVVNRQELEKLDKVMSLLSVRWEKVAGHRGVRGNEAADRLANKGAALYVKK